MVDKLLANMQAKQSRKKESSYDIVKTSDGALSRVRYVLTTGIDSFDHCTGGLPFGRIVEIMGLEASGKTAMAWRATTRAYQRCIFEKVKDPETKLVTWRQVPEDGCEVFILYIDNEQSLDDTDKLIIDGVEIKDGIVGRCDTVSDMFEMITDFISGVKTLADADPANKDDPENPVKPYFMPIIIDTLAATSSDQEVNADWDNVDFVRQPAQLRRGFRRITRSLMRENVLLIVTNQISAKFGGAKKRGPNLGPQPDDFESFGGMAMKYYASLRVFIQVTNPTYKLNKKSVGGPSGFVSKFTVIKNRQVKPRRSGRIVLLYDRGLSNIFSILETMAQLKLVDKSELGIYSFRFDAAGFKPTTFSAQASRGNPKLPSLMEWPAFYEEHKEDIDKLWARGKELIFTDDGLPSTDEELTNDEPEPAAAKGEILDDE